MKIKNLLLTAALVIMLSLSAAAYEVGEVIGKTLNTDIAAYINHYAIESHLINNTLCIPADELLYYGFDVAWNAERKSLDISRGSKNQIAPRKTVFRNTAAVGTENTDILYTDIKAFINGKEIPSYNVNQRTMIAFDELSAFGTEIWVPEVHSLKLWVEGLPVAPFSYLPFEDMYDTYANSKVPDYTAVTNEPKLSVDYSNGVASNKYNFNAESIDKYIDAVKYLNFDVEEKIVGTAVHYKISKGETNYILSADAIKEVVWIAVVDLGELPTEFYPNTTLPTYSSILGKAVKYTVYFSGAPSVYGYNPNGEGFTYDLSSREVERYIYHVKRLGFEVSEPINSETHKETAFIFTKNEEKYQLIIQTERNILCVRTIFA